VRTGGRQLPNSVDAIEGEFFSQQADALVHIARSFLVGDTSKQASSADHYQVMIHVDENAINNESGKSDEHGTEAIKR